MYVEWKQSLTIFFTIFLVNKKNVTLIFTYYPKLDPIFWSTPHLIRFLPNILPDFPATFWTPNHNLKIRILYFRKKKMVKMEEVETL